MYTTTTKLQICNKLNVSGNDIAKQAEMRINSYMALFKCFAYEKCWTDVYHLLH